MGIVSVSYRLPVHSPRRDSRVQIHLHLATIVMVSAWQPLEGHTQRNREETNHDRLVRVVELDIERVDSRPTAGLPGEDVLASDDPGVVGAGRGDGPVDGGDLCWGSVSDGVSLASETKPDSVPQRQDALSPNQCIPGTSHSSRIAPQSSQHHARIPIASCSF
jgi:hypothetical protein